MSERRHINQVRIFWIHPHARNLPGIFEADVLPRLSRVHRFIHAVAIRHIAPNVILAGSHIDDVGIGFGNSDVTDRRGAEALPIGDWVPTESAVHRFPYSSYGAAEVINIRLGFNSCNRRHPSAPERADQTPLQGLYIVYVLRAQYAG